VKPGRALFHGEHQAVLVLFSPYAQTSDGDRDFFGHQHSAYDFFYEDELTGMKAPFAFLLNDPRLG
jgi:hypothetical protein